VDRDLTDGRTRRAVFFDRDGTLNVDREYVGDPQDVELVPNAAKGARMLSDAGYVLVVVSNQSGIARGFFTEDDAAAVDERLAALLAERGVTIAASYRCPHLPNAPLPEYAVACDCRKPLPGLIFRAAADLSLDPKRSWAIGDRPRDIAAGAAAGCRTVAVDPGPPPREPEDFGATQPDYRAHDLVDAARRIIAHT
jgi:D-glycero-D-manno-heptose 1,7-bisphosphate phosphatase